MPRSLETKRDRREVWLIASIAGFAGGKKSEEAMTAADKLLEGYDKRFKAEEDAERAAYKLKHPDRDLDDQ